MIYPIAMNMIEDRLNLWGSACQTAFHDALTLFQAFFAAKDAGDPDTDFVLGQLSASCTMTSESALLLIENVRLWDAEALVRSVLEGTYKFAFMCLRADEERANRVREYYYDLPEISRLKRHDRASSILSSVEDPVADEWRPLRDLVLSQAEVEALRSKFPRKQRQALEQKWSFFPLAQAIAQSELPGGEALAGMVYTYGISSHILHQDGDGVSIIMERSRRSFERQQAIELSHGARELSDLLHMAFYRAIAAYHLKELDPRPIFRSMEQYTGLFEELARAYDTWREVEYGRSGEQAC